MLSHFAAFYGSLVFHFLLLCLRDYLRDRYRLSVFINGNHDDVGTVDYTADTVKVLGVGIYADFHG